MDNETALMAFSALSNSTRLSVIKLLVKAGDAGLTAGEISDAMDASPSKMSFHLSALSKASLVSSTRKDRQITYKADFAAIGKLVQFILVDCCSNNSAVLNCCGISGEC